MPTGPKDEETDVRPKSETSVTHEEALTLSGETLTKEMVKQARLLDSHALELSESKDSAREEWNEEE